MKSVDMPSPKVRERLISGVTGIPLLAVSLVLVLGGIPMVVLSIVWLAQHGGFGRVVLLVGCALALLCGLILMAGLTQVAPGEARVVQLLGRYTGTIRTTGLRWVNPITDRKPISTRIRNHETAVMKVNEADGNPIEIAAVVVWQVEDTAQALFEVDNFVQFVAIQTETAVRHIANGYPYDAHADGQLSLRDNADEITEKLSAEVAERVRPAGVRIIESRITHLAYAQEIAQAMLQRQQAGAVVAARQRIVEGAVGMVQMALDRLAEQEVVELDEERRAAMVSNLLVVLCGHRDAAPVVNTGSLYT
ncbi:SPFH domain-containing protein [Amycolatopsis suaedae]|uniref:SPFH domain-containing protein n=1 Tax=Amycolatopsis suaedae TaxID=2510978 RepID=A0A4Q7IZX8_9PSEU|nr:SPFH domain-containing protein [Amycolatopsis suaedae]RZQ60079.1 SPFH domain-containing protein [Amycolatopsis suaedae]